MCVCLYLKRQTDTHPERECYLFKSSKIHILFSAHGTFARIDYMLSHKASHGKFKKIDIISSIFSDYSTMRLEYEQLTHWKSPWCWERLRVEGEEAVRGWNSWWHHWCNGRELGQTLGDGEGQGVLASCHSWSCKELGTTGWLNKKQSEEELQFIK